MNRESAYFALGLAILAVPVLLVVRERQRTQRLMKVFGTQPGAVFPHRDPILGLDWVRLMNDALSSDQLLEAWHSLFHQVGNTYWVNTIGRWLLMTCEPDNIKAILASQFDTWHMGGVRQKAISQVIGPHAIFATNGAEWARSRALIRPSFVRNQIADLECTDRHVENLLARLHVRSPPPTRNGDPAGGVDLQALFYMFTMDTSTDFMFGHSTNMLVDPSDDAVEFTKAFDYALMITTRRARMGWLWTLMPNQRFDQSVARCRAFIDRYVTAALAQDKPSERPYVFMKELVDSGASHQQITDQLLAMILGGRDTSASTLSSLFWMLSRKPAVVRSLRAELDHLEGRRPSWEELKGLKYLNVVKEALRLWPPVSSNARVARKDTVLPMGGGRDGKSPLLVPKGTECRFSTYSLQRREDIYGEDANEFRPERWDTLRNSWEYIPFSGGPRICVGQQFALTLISYVTARILQAVESIEPRDSRPMLQKTSSTVSLTNGCWVSLTPVSNAPEKQ